MSRFITFEGVDGAGKSSHIEWLADRLRAGGAEVVATREPGGTPLAEKLRGLLLSEAMDPDTETMLMFAARREHYVDVIAPALARDAWVISDRFSDSNFAYQGGGKGVDVERIRALERWIGEPRPSLTLLFDLPVEMARKRLEGVREPDKFEREKVDFFDRVRAGFLDRARLDPGRFLVLDASRSVEEIRAEIGGVPIFADSMRQS